MTGYNALSNSCTDEQNKSGPYSDTGSKGLSEYIFNQKSEE